MFCDHDWQPRTGMDSGSICGKCGKASSREVDISSSGVLGNTQLLKKGQTNNFMNLVQSSTEHYYGREKPIKSNLTPEERSKEIRRRLWSR